jgi:pro-apoptotic serine protease NMA111
MLSILPGTISRLDRNAPEYAKEDYQDFDINYIQASVNGSGGSSGSPVLNSHNLAVALQCGRKVNAGTGFFLPLDRPLRAL